MRTAPRTTRWIVLRTPDNRVVGGAVFGRSVVRLWRTSVEMGRAGSETLRNET